MPEIIHCPECDRTVSLPERLIGKIVRCPSCRKTFRAEAPVEEEAEPVVVDAEPPRPRDRKPSSQDEDDRSRRRRRDEEGDDSDARPRRARRREEEDEDDRPRRRSRDRDEEEDEEEDRPRRKRPKLTGDEVWSWKRVRVGLAFVLAAAALGLIANVVGVLWIKSIELFEKSAIRSGEMPAWAGPLTSSCIILLVVYFLLCFVGVGLSIGGNIVCMAFRGKLSARSTLTSCIAMLILGMFLVAGGLVYLGVRVRLWGEKFESTSSAPPGAPPFEGLIVIIFGATLLLAQPGVFSLFVRNVADGTRQGGLAISLIFQAIIAGVVAIAFVFAAMSMYSSLTGAMSARFEGGSRGGVQEVGDAAW